MEHSRLKILAWHQSGFISIRENNDLIHLCFKNLLLNFSLTDFCAFRRMTKEHLAKKYLVLFPDGSSRIILGTPYEGINFSFKLSEIRNLVDVLDEAFYMQEIYSLLNDH